MSFVSPELALVDPSLAYATETVGDNAPDCLRRRPLDAAIVPLGTPLKSRAPSPAALAPVNPALRDAVVAEWLDAFAGTTLEVDAVVVAPTVAWTPAAFAAEWAAIGAAPPAPAPLILPPPQAATRETVIVVNAPRPVVKPRPETQPRHARRRSERLVTVVAAWSVVGAIVASPLLAFLPADSSQRPQLQTGGSAVAVAPPVKPANPAKPADPAKPSRSVPGTPLPTPKTRPVGTQKQSPASAPQSSRAPSGERATSRRLRWKRVAGAAVYNVILMQGNTRIDVWTVDPQLVLPTVAASDKRGHEYAWFVYAGTRTKQGITYGSMLAHGTINTIPSQLPRSTSDTPVVR